VVWSELGIWHNAAYKRPKSSLKVAAALVGAASVHGSAEERIFEASSEAQKSMYINLI
jgi:hypothetical protein